MLFKYIWHLITMQKELYQDFKRRHDMYAAVKEYRRRLAAMPDYNKSGYGITKVGEIVVNEDGTMEFVKTEVEDDS